MLNLILSKIFFFYIFIIPFIYAEYVVNPDGEDCSHAPDPPSKKEDCTNYNTEDKACCFATVLLEDRTTRNKCISVDKDARFALNHLTIFSFEGYDHIQYDDVTATFECGQKDKFCGMDSPSKLFQCSEHSSTTKSCCFLTTPTYTECILSDQKYNKEKNFKLFETSTVVCKSYNIQIKNYILIFDIFLMIYILGLF